MAERDSSEGGHSGSSTMVDLAAELFTLVRRHLKEVGVNEGDQQVAFAQSRSKDPKPVSGGVMRGIWGLGELLTEWSRSAEYLDADGRPKILKIEGRGQTFETLVKRFLPDRSVQEVIEFASKTAEIELLPRKRIALVGGLLVNAANSRETLLAHTVRHLDFLLSTLSRNTALPAEDRSARGYMERMVVGVIRKDAMADFMRQLRPQIYELLLQFDTAVEQRAPSSPSDVSEATTAAIGVYVAEEADWARTGVDPGPSTSDQS